jgi:hypothetical protein
MNDYVVIPGDILRNKDLTFLKKLVLAKISNLDNDKGCFATNKYFANLLNSTVGSISKTINQLAKMKLIEITIIDNTNRTITLSQKCRGGVVKVEGGCRKSVGSPVTINIESNIEYKTLDSITSNVIEEFQKKYTNIDVKEKYNELVLYCESTGKKYKDYKATLNMWVIREEKRLKESKPYIQENKTKTQVDRQRKEFNKTQNKYTDEDCANFEEIGDILTQYTGGRKDVSDA